MKRRPILSILFILCLSFQASAWCPTTVLSGTSETAIACSSCTPGDPSDIFCEDCDNSDNFWCSWTDDVDGTNTVACANHSGTLACTDKGSKAIEITIDGDQGELASKYQAVTENAVYIHFYLNLKTWSGMDNLDEVVLIQVYEADYNTLARLWIYDISGTPRLYYIIDGQAGDEVEAGPYLTVGTWYDVEFSWQRNTANGVNLNVNDTDYALDDGQTTIDVNCERIYIGSTSLSGGIGAGEDIVIQMDNIEVDNDTMPDDCPE